MEKHVVFSLGVIGVVGASAASIWLSAVPKTSCVDEVIEITNASNVPAAVLLAPQPILETLSSSILPKTVTDKIDNVIVVAGITPVAVGEMALIKLLIDVNTPKDDIVLKDAEANLHKQPHQCRIGGKSYNIYVGKTLMDGK